MDFLKRKISNKNNELLDVWVEGNEKSEKTIIFVHGFATDKHETAGYFNGLVKALENKFRIIRFDFSGCGESEGKLEEKDYEKWSEDLSVVADYVRDNFQGDVYIFAQSMGCFVTALLSPSGIKKTVFTGVPNNNTQYIIESLFLRFGKKPGGKIDFQGISLLPRSTGKTQKIGPSFWEVIKNLKPKETVEAYSKKTDLMIIHPKQDEVVGNQFLKEYSKIPGVKIKWLDGDHSFSKPEDRSKLIFEIERFFTV